LLVLGPGNFHPRPKVDSQVLRIIFHPVPNAVRELPEHDHGLLHTIVNAAFQQRRKTLLNSLSAGNIHGLDKTAWKHIIEQSGISAQTRPELLTTGDFVSITRIVQGTINS
jgi:16S rRNA (adenine1518-N6/adenine1519-N6)-dimethyltransferase